MFYAAIPGMPELGMVWMGDMMVHNDPTQELMIDPQQADNSYYTHSFDDLRNHQMPQTAMVRYLTPQFQNECSEQEGPMEGIGVLDIQQEYTQSDGQEINEYLGFEDYIVDEEQDQGVNNASTQTQDSRNRKIKPIKHPGLVLKTPIAYEPHTDLNFIPIRKDGMAVCEKCGAIGVKHAFYTKERRFCSRACARTSEHSTIQADFNSSSSSQIEQKLIVTNIPKDVKPLLTKVKEEVDILKESTVKEKIKQAKVNDNDLLKLLPRKKRPAEMAKSYDWTPQLKAPGFCAAPVSCFKHAPISEMWDNISIGMKVEVANTDCDEEFPNSFWVATVLRISGYRALLRYEGFGQNVEDDFWVSLCSNDIQPVGWCASIGQPLIPPKTIANKYKDWKDFLTRRLTGARTLPTNFYSKVNESMKSRFRCGLNVEVVDKNRISQVKVATVQNIIGKRLHVRYYDASPEDSGFWCHEDSPLLHPVGWAKRVGHTLDAYPEYLQRIESGKLSKEDARNELFIRVRNNLAHLRFTFQEGMKIEAIDPLNLSAICAATVMRVLREGYIMIRIDSYDEDSTGADWFCYHSCSPCIFPIGFCAQHGLPFTPPKGYDPTSFSWDSYLEETNTVAAPLHLFDREIPQHGFIEGMRLEAADLMDPRLVCVATITRVIGRLLRVHFDGWEDEYDQWMDCQSPDIYPVGWCDLVDHKLEGPRVSAGKTMNPPPMKSPRCLKRRGRRKRRNFGARTILTRNLLSRQSEMLHQQARLETTNDQARGPAQGIKIEQERGEIEGIPAQAIGPELATEPAGPDQTMPSPTSGQGLAEQSQCQSSFEPPPKEKSTELCINAKTANSKYIPKIADGFPRGSEFELIPREWNFFDVAEFLRVNDCAAYCESFNKRKIDGNALLALTKDQIFDLTEFKVGPSLKIFDLVQQLKSKVNVAHERSKFGIKKPV